MPGGGYRVLECGVGRHYAGCLRVEACMAGAIAGHGGNKLRHLAVYLKTIAGVQAGNLRTGIGAIPTGDGDCVIGAHKVNPQVIANLLEP